MSNAGRKNLDSYRESERIRQKNGRAKLRSYILELKKSGCSRCEEKHPACLQFHHIDPSNKIDRVNRLLAQTKSMKKVMAEVAKCELICANCHAKEHWEQSH